jgi:hypothetical protein
MQPLPELRAYKQMSFCHGTAIRLTVTVGRTIGKSGCEIPTATLSCLQARMDQQMGIGGRR